MYQQAYNPGGNPNDGGSFQQQQPYGQPVYGQPVYGQPVYGQPSPMAYAVPPGGGLLASSYMPVCATLAFTMSLGDLLLLEEGSSFCALHILFPLAGWKKRTTNDNKSH